MTVVRKVCRPPPSAVYIEGGSANVHAHIICTLEFTMQAKSS